MTQDGSNNGALKLDGMTLDEGIQRLLNAYLVEAQNGDKVVPADHPVLTRQRRLSKFTEGIENIVKGILSDAIKLDPNSPEHVRKSDVLISRLAYEIARRDLYKGPFEEFAKNEELISKYLSQAGTALNNPTIGNRVELKKEILNMPAARPGDPLYSRESALAQLIQYIATQSDDESRQINYITQLFQQHATDARYISSAQQKLGHPMGKSFSPAATIPEILGELRREGELRAQQYAAKTGKTYLKPAADSAGAPASH